ncbi:MAG TPA: ATP-binding cassette domain-containing protein, partial [Gemmatimonadaceae bacterium]|nr:ATP-binding cassette domain-containing protein [Gemmatimonadaceae bacterium]
MTTPGGTNGGDRRQAERRGDERPAQVRQAIRTALADDVAGAGQPVAGRDTSVPVIALKHVDLAFDKPILEDITLAANVGETVAVVGESGTGKSTMLKLILRLLTPDRGSVEIDGQDIAHLSFDEALEVRKKMGMVFQGAALFDSMSVFENVAYPLHEHFRLSDEDVTARVREKLEFVDLDPDEVLDKLPSELSGGMRKRVGIARAMAGNPEIML